MADADAFSQLPWLRANGDQITLPSQRPWLIPFKSCFCLGPSFVPDWSFPTVPPAFCNVFPTSSLFPTNEDPSSLPLPSLPQSHRPSSPPGCTHNILTDKSRRSELIAGYCRIL